MKTEEEIRKRLDELYTSIGVANQYGNYDLSRKVKREIDILEWVLEE